MFTVKTAGYIPIGFELPVYYLKSIGHENEYFCYIGEDYLDVVVEKMDEIKTNFANFPRKKSWL